MTNSFKHFGTDAIHAGQEHDPVTGAVSHSVMYFIFIHTKEYEFET